MKKLNKRKIGTDYEEMAAKYLVEQGYEILERNYRNKFGEIDIIATRQNIVAYIEIKYRSTSQYGDPLEAVDVRKQRRISKVAMVHYLYRYPHKDKQCRFDVIGMKEDGTITHIENAFYYQG